VDYWIKPQFKIDTQTLRNMVDTGKTARFLRGMKRYPPSSAYDGAGRSSGILYFGVQVQYPYIPVLTLNGKDVELAPGIGWHHNPGLIEELATQRAGATNANADAIDVPSSTVPTSPPPQLAEPAELDELGGEPFALPM
jgi:hypothetical protein